MDKILTTQHAMCALTFKVTLPYPVGVASIANFSMPRGKYKPPARRRIAVAFSGTDKTIFRHFLRSQFSASGGTVTKAMSYKCTSGHGGPLCGIGTNTHIYKQVINTDFCLEPTGDTPTRSHFYLAVLAGCIPVIFDFDRGHALRHTFPGGDI